jgi:hypothetical protein
MPSHFSLAQAFTPAGRKAIIVFFLSGPFRGRNGLIECRFDGTRVSPTVLSLRLVYPFSHCIDPLRLPIGIAENHQRGDKEARRLADPAQRHARPHASLGSPATDSESQRVHRPGQRCGVSSRQRRNPAQFQVEMARRLRCLDVTARRIGEGVALHRQPRDAP